ncbi:MAG: class I SAM-dependent rRNA methyltransferase [Moorellales bacterium]
MYQTEIASIKGDWEPGDLVEVLDEQGRFLGRGYFNPTSTIAVRLLTRRKEAVDRGFFHRRLVRAWEYRRRLLSGLDTDAVRVVFAEADFLPGLIVDKFADHLVLQTLTLGMERWKSTLAELLDELFRPRGLYEKNDAGVRAREGLSPQQGWIKGGPDPIVTIREHGLRFYVDLVRGQKTGYFLDQRENRAALRGLVEGARVLDAFCYTGGFALHAAACGAREVLALDLSEEAVALAEANARLNHLADRCRFYVANAFDELRNLERAGESFEVVILDPPAFTKSKSALEGAWRGYKEINLRAMRLLAPGGFLITSSCSYHLPEEQFLEVVRAAARDARRTLRLVEMRRQSRDHPVLLEYPESYYLKCLILQVL